MRLTETEFEENFKNLYDSYKIKNPSEVKGFIKNNENLFELLDKTKIHLNETFPQGLFELEVYYDLSGEGNDSLLVNIYVDEETFNNGFTDKILDIDMKILPLQKELDLLMKLCLMEGISSERELKLS
ncbi:hypothetical protein [Methanobrevibacter sp.]|uniref:hypothetical protein n=1 Tax=Methanobrevibacter sp. TaxID=66852 RepID=UPI00387003D1